MKKILFYTINQNIVDQALVSLNSFVSNNSGYDIKLFCFDFSEKNKNHIKSKIGQYFNNVEIIFSTSKNTEKVPGRFKKIQGLLNKKFELIYELRKEYDIVVYSDPDVIFRKNIVDIENYVSKDPGFYAQTENNFVEGWVKVVKRLLNLKKYFNCGFLVCNSEIKNFSLEEYENVSKILNTLNFCPEQNYMNYYYDIKELKPDHCYLWVNKLELDPFVVHFFSFYKPWQTESLKYAPSRFYLNITKFYKDFRKYASFKQ